MIAALQGAIYTALNDNITLSSRVTGIYDEVPQSAVNPDDASDYPYIVIHEQMLDNNDTDTELGFNGTVQIHTWSVYDGNKEVYEIMQLIYDSLHYANLIVTGYGVSTIHQEYSEVLRDPDGITRHGVQRFRVILEPTI